jgi:hypothetical protein
MNLKGGTMALELAAALGKAEAIADRIGLWQKLLDKLVGNTELAATHLGGALGEVRKTFGSLRDTILEVSYLGVSGQDPVDVRRALDRIETGQLHEQVISAKGSCHKIGNIYDRHLKAWFKKVVKPDEDVELRKLFDELRNSDGWAVDACERLLLDAKPLAREIRQLLDAGNEDQARQRVLEFTATCRHTLDKLSATMVSMLELEATFLRTHRVT